MTDIEVATFMPSHSKFSLKKIGLIIKKNFLSASAAAVSFPYGPNQLIGVRVICYSKENGFSVFDLIRTKNIRKIFIKTSIIYAFTMMIYYGLAYNAAGLPGSL